MKRAKGVNAGAKEAKASKRKGKAGKMDGENRREMKGIEEMGKAMSGLAPHDAGAAASHDCVLIYHKQRPKYAIGLCVCLRVLVLSCACAYVCSCVLVCACVRLCVC